MKQKIVLRRRAVPLNVTLPNGTTFAVTVMAIIFWHFLADVLIPTSKTILDI